MKVVYHILRYFKMTPRKGLFFKRTQKRNIKVFSNANWIGSITDRRSTLRNCNYIWGNLVTWQSKKQFVVAQGSVKAEFRVMTHGICEGMWLKRLPNKLKILVKDSIKMFCTIKLP